MLKAAEAMPWFVTGNNLITGSKTFGKTEAAYLPQ